MKKRTWLALVVFACLLGAVYWQSKKKPEAGITRLSFTKIAPADVTALEINGTHPMDMKRKNGKWMLSDGKPASRTGPKAAVKALTAIDSTDLVTENPKRFSDFGVDANDGTHVVAKSHGKVIADLVVGRHGRGGTFVRQGNEVYLVSGLYPSTFSKPSALWHQLGLFHGVSASKVTQVTVRLHGEKPYTLVEKNKHFAFKGSPALPKGFRFSRSAARAVASTLVGARASDDLETDPGLAKTGLGPDADVLAFVAGSQHGTLLLGKAAKKSEVYAKVGGRADVYLVSKGLAEALRKRPVDLRDLRFVSLDPAKVTRLEIRHGKTHLVIARTAGHWKAVSGDTGKPPDDAAVAMRLSSIAEARGMSVAADAAPAKTGLARPEGLLVATLASGKKVTVRFGKATKDANGHPAVYARGNMDDLVYLVSPWVRDHLLGGAATLVHHKRPRFNRAMLERLLRERAQRQGG